MFVLQQSLRIEKACQEVVDSLHESTERYHTLIEATTCCRTNQIMLPSGSVSRLWRANRRQASLDEITTAYDFLMQLRLQSQLAGLQSGRSPQNIIHHSKLGYIQQELLKQAFIQIATVQKKVSYDFLERKERARLSARGSYLRQDVTVERPEQETAMG